MVQTPETPGNLAPHDTTEDVGALESLAEQLAPPTEEVIRDKVQLVIDQINRLRTQQLNQDHDQMIQGADSVRQLTVEATLNRRLAHIVQTTPAGPPDRTAVERWIVFQGAIYSVQVVSPDSHLVQASAQVQLTQLAASPLTAVSDAVTTDQLSPLLDGVPLTVVTATPDATYSALDRLSQALDVLNPPSHVLG